MKQTNSILRSAILAALFLLGLGACGADEPVVSASGGESATTTEPASTETTNRYSSAPETPPEEGDTPDPTITGGPDEEPLWPGPPPVEVTRGAEAVTLDAWTYCWTPAEFDVGVCADGEPPAQPPLVSGDGPIILSFPAEFTFSAQSYDSAYAEVTGDVTIDPVDAGWKLTTSVEGPGIIEVFGRGPEGDVSVSFAVD